MRSRAKWQRTSLLALQVSWFLDRHRDTRQLTAVGLMAGSHFLNGWNGVHPRDAQLFHAFNTLAQSVGAGEGILPNSARGLAGVVGAGAGLIGRVPT
jgi:hypothetical protein